MFRQALTIIFSFTITACFCQSQQSSNFSDNKYDSIVIFYFESVSFSTCFFKYSYNKLEITERIHCIKKLVTDSIIINRFQKFINEFYIERKSKINFDANKSKPETNYTAITATAYKNNKKIINERTVLYSNTEFNPEFIEFYKFLDKLAIKMYSAEYYSDKDLY